MNLYTEIKSVIPYINKMIDIDITKNQETFLKKYTWEFRSPKKEIVIGSQFPLYILLKNKYKLDSYNVAICQLKDQYYTICDYNKYKVYLCDTFEGVKNLLTNEYRNYLKINSEKILEKPIRETYTG